MDTEKENEADESKDDAEKELDLEDTSNAENVSNPAEESEENSEVTELTEEGNFDVDPNDDNETEEVSQSQNDRESLVPVKKNLENVDEKTVESDIIKQTDNSSKQKTRNNQKEDNVNGKKKIREGKPFTKVVIRRLPPSMTKEVFIDQVSPLPTYDYFYFVPANMSSPGGFSRAYINFINQNDLFDFTRTFDNYVFIDAKGHEYPAIVEFAPYQRVPKVRQGRKKDSLMGTLESDPVYLTFKEQLQAEELENSRTTNKQHYFETEINESEEVVTTPLLEFLKARRAEKDRIREEKREDRKRKEAERKLLKQKIKDKPQDEEIEIKMCEESIHSCKSEESSSREEEEDNETNEEKISDEPVIKAILVKPRDKLEIEESRNDKSDVILDESDSTSKNDFLKSKIIENSEREKAADEISVISEDRDRYRGYFQGKSYDEGWEHREPGDMYRFSKFRYWERQVRSGGSGYRYRRMNRIDLSPRNRENCYDWSSSYSRYNSSVLQPPKDKKEFTKEKDVKRVKHKEKDDRFVKPENRTREFKNKGGKSYREERLKQAEKREEKKKKESEESKEVKDEANIEEEVKEEEKYWSDKKKWKYGGGGDTKGGRTFSRRRDEKKKEMFDRKRGSGKPYRSRKGSGESLDDNPKKEKSENTSESSEKTPRIVNSDKSEVKESPNLLKKEKESVASRQEETQHTKKDGGSTAAQKSVKEKDNHKVKEKLNLEQVKETKTTEKDVPSSEVSKKERLQKESSVDSEEGGKTAKDPRAERRIRNKDRPSIEIYRPGMGKFSRQRLEKEKTLGSTDESPSHSPSPTHFLHTHVFVSHNLIKIEKRQTLFLS